jgi:hypothetical protein
MPLVLCEGITVVHKGDGSGPQDAMFYTLPVRNFGKGLALRLHCKTDMIVNGESRPPAMNTKNAIVTAPPDKSFDMSDALVVNPQYDAVLKGMTKLEAAIDCYYDSVTEESYHSHAKYIFDWRFRREFTTVEEWCKDSNGRPCGTPEQCFLDRFTGRGRNKSHRQIENGQ